jgi:hypothetical protein
MLPTSMDFDEQTAGAALATCCKQVCKMDLNTPQRMCSVHCVELKLLTAGA